MNYYTKALAKELGAAHKIRVNIVTPVASTPGGDIIAERDHGCNGLTC